MRQVLRGPTLPAIVAVCAVAWVIFLHPGRRTEAPPAPTPVTELPYTEQARALLGGLDEGDEIEGGWRVRRVYGPHEGRIVIELELGAVQMDVFFSQSGAHDAASPLQNPRFDFFYTEIDAQSVPPGAVPAAVGAISVRITDAPTPDGM